jgi:septal ring factor EnvC (AmiA/AmiB activator)
MKKQRLKAVALSTVLSASALIGSVAHADQTLNSILQVGEQKTKLAQTSQQKIDTIADQTASLLNDFKVVNKQIEGLRVYNSQLEKQLANQLTVISQLEESIANVTVMERQIQPLILKMLDGLEQFVALDVPFHKQEREERLAMLRNNQERADISVSEKFRQVLEAYKIESEYGRKIDTYKDTLNVGGQEREVNVFRVGRVALMYQTTDTELSGAWDQRQQAWVELDSGEYRSAILKGIRIAKKQASIDVLNLPILAPEAAQ